MKLRVVWWHDNDGLEDDMNGLLQFIFYMLSKILLVQIQIFLTIQRPTIFEY